MKTFHQRAIELQEEYGQELYSLIDDMIPDSFEYMGLSWDLEDGTEQGRVELEWFDNNARITFAVWVYGNGSVYLYLDDDEDDCGSEIEQEDAELDDITAFIRDEIPNLLAARAA